MLSNLPQHLFQVPCLSCVKLRRAEQKPTDHVFTRGTHKKGDTPGLQSQKGAMYLLEILCSHLPKDVALLTSLMQVQCWPDKHQQLGKGTLQADADRGCVHTAELLNAQMWKMVCRNQWKYLSGFPSPQWWAQVDMAWSKQRLPNCAHSHPYQTERELRACKWKILATGLLQVCLTLSPWEWTGHFWCNLPTLSLWERSLSKLSRRSPCCPEREIHSSAVSKPSAPGRAEQTVSMAKGCSLPEAGAMAVLWSRGCCWLGLQKMRVGIKLRCPSEDPIFLFELPDLCWLPVFHLVMLSVQS